MNQSVGGKGEGRNATEGGRLMGDSNTTSHMNSSYRNYSFLYVKAKNSKFMLVLGPCQINKIQTHLVSILKLKK